MRVISLTSLRNKLFKIVDEIIETSVPVEIERKGHKLKIVLEQKKVNYPILNPIIVL
ncbi:MAG: type II toxin-antitoxin system Phd/YefM family antitoxin [bacterium]